MIIPEGFYIVKVGWERFVIGHMPMADPGRPDYKPFANPEPIYSEPKRFIVIDNFAGKYSTEPVSPLTLWDDKTKEFDRYYTEFEKEEEKRYKCREELESKGIDTRGFLW